jgi:phosphosulfolactate phosphohydrolase-like enzyme
VRVDRLLPGLLGDQALEAAVVIDVLRATTTAIVLLARGVPAVRVVATSDELAALPPGDYLVFSELDAARASRLPCVDNSPATAEEVDLAGRVPVLVTTNGTRAVAAAMRCARDVFVAGFVNLASTAHHLRAAGRVTLLPAGDFAAREIRTEDERCADALEQILAGQVPDLPALIAACRDDARVQRRIARHPELVRDVAIALAVDRHDVVARALATPAGFELVRAA